MNQDSFDEFRSLVYAKSGITLGQGKEALVSSRVGKRMRQLGLGDFRSYLDWVKGKGGEDEMVQLLDAISTNVTSFFREPEHFDFVREKMTDWLGKKQTRFRLWSAASSTGEEPYTLAMTLRECQPGPECDIRILATDISTRVLAAAQEGIYPESKMSTLPGGYAARYFTKRRDKDSVVYAAGENLRNLILYKRLNLAFPPFPMQGPMDMILCRNVMIYFDNPVRERLLAEFHRLLRPGGYLLVGHSESLTGLSVGFKSIRPSIYRKDA
ncbi:MAG: methyltransferase, CheR-type [Fibrobacteres bacterium]|nr:methyltransferase, CheR-type [Fibrobacterota bacterium]